MSDRTNAIWSTAGGVALILALGAITLGISQCIGYERWKERSCMQQGGALINNPAPGSGQNNNRDACMKVDVQMTPLVMPKQ